MIFDKKKIKLILLTTLSWGILAHGMSLFNKFSFHDDVGIFNIGSTYESGRWMLGILDLVCRKLFGSLLYSSPLFMGCLTIFFIALTNILITDLLEINNKYINIGLSGIMVVFPTITAMFGYIYTAPYYFFGTFIGILGIWLISRYKKWYYLITSMILMACSVGIYQSNIPVIVGILLIAMIKLFYDDDNLTLKNKFKIIGLYIFICIGFMCIYFSINTLMLHIQDIQLLDYKGINNFGKTSFRGYIDRIFIAYKEFFNPTDLVARNMYPYSINILYKIIIISSLIITIYMLEKKYSKKISHGLLLLLLIIALPLSANFIYFMCEISTIHSLMMYGQIVFFVYFAWLLDKTNFKHNKFNNIFKRTMLIIIFIMNIMWCRFDNICYLKAEFMQQRAISYFTALTTDIKNTEGYMDEMSIVYINEFQKTDLTITYTPEFVDIYINPYSGNTLINNYKWRFFMKMWCGFNPNTLSQTQYTHLEDVKNMPCYPDDGSIKIIDNVVIVKFSN